MPSIEIVPLLTTGSSAHAPRAKLATTASILKFPDIVFPPNKDLPRIKRAEAILSKVMSDLYTKISQYLDQVIKSETRYGQAIIIAKISKKDR